jgi:ADP-heptose:LPS heptosyltransferase
MAMNLLVFRTGLLGDTLVGVPALSALRSAFPDAHIVYVYGSRDEQIAPLSQQVLGESGLVDGFESYYSGPKVLRRASSTLMLLWKLRKTPWDLAIVLEEPYWPVHRNVFAALCGAKKVVGTTGSGISMPRDKTGKLLRVDSIVDTLVAVLKPLDIVLPAPGGGRFDLRLGKAEEKRVDEWLKRVGGRQVAKPWIGIGMWSNMSAKRWPLERYESVISALIREHDVTPFLLGGAGEKMIARELIRHWGRGYSACGELDVRAGIELLRRCSVYLGNDTGVMHMAVAAGIPCVAIFSSHQSPGRWEPYGRGHIVFRAEVSCEGCGLVDCVSEEMRCIKTFSADDVFMACRKILDNKT